MGDTQWGHSNRRLPRLADVAQAPYIWSYSLNSWIFMEEPAAVAPGAWGYFFN